MIRKNTGVGGVINELIQEKSPLLKNVCWKGPQGAQYIGEKIALP